MTANWRCKLGYGEERAKAADAAALARVFLACVTGRDADVATAADIPPGTSDSSRDLCERAISGGGVDSLAKLLEALGTFDTRVLRGLPSGVDSLPLSIVRAVEADKRRKRDRLEAARKAFTGPRVTAGLTIARETLAKAEVEAEAVTGGIPLVVHAAQEPVPEELEDLHDLLTFDAMVDEQVARSKPTNAELLYERLHKRWPDSRRITKRLERAHERAISGGPINATPILLTLFVGGIVVLVIVAMGLLSQGLVSDHEPDSDLDNYPSYSYGP